MDRTSRNRIQRATQEARALLERDYAEQLEGTFDIRRDGTVANGPGPHLSAEQRLIRSKLVAAVTHLRSASLAREEAVASYLRESAFTTLNRFVALKMLEARGLFQECISRGFDSSGFREFTGLVPGILQRQEDGYRLYIESLFDEVGREVRVLFDRRDPAGLLWPRRQPLLQLLDVLNARELSPVWGEDETIGWVYQYFNSDEDRRRARYDDRGKPKAPQSSYELAVRNQFFTPRYVVQFLTDNTLGRIWYEMRHGKTGLRDLDYLVRFQNEVFLAQGQGPRKDAKPEGTSVNDTSQRRTDVPFRRKKDPRDIRVLDPACGSGHFLLYAFDLLISIYTEAWHDPESPVSESTGQMLRDDYPDFETLRATMPSLILLHNLHGVDIDARCAQIAALALWMRAQRAYSDMGVGRNDRPAIQRTNIVVAEPMPGDRTLRREFVAMLDANAGQLVDRIFDRMALAGYAGSLLRIEDDIRAAVREIYRDFGELFRESDEERWHAAEQKVLCALEAFVKHAVHGDAFQRRLFAEDAARGLGFIDLCAQRYDVVLMNPPFGAFAKAVKDWAASAWPRTKNDIYAAFVERGVRLLLPGGRLGAITSRTGFFLSSFQKWRQEILLKDAPPVVVADLGHGVMDDAMVEAAAYCLETSV